MRYISIVSVTPTADGGWHAPSFENQTRVQARKLSNVLLWMGTFADGDRTGQVYLCVGIRKFCG